MTPNTPQELYEQIKTSLLAENQDIIVGNMMSAPGLKVKDKVFAFIHKNEMGFRLGNDFDPAAHGIHDWHLLSPFKTKPPLKAWFILSETEREHWPELSRLALRYTKALK